MPEEIADQEGIKAPELVELPHFRGKDFQLLYSNFAQCGRGAWDIAIAFGLITESEPGKAAVMDLVNVNMTPALAKALVGVLNATVKQYELENGEVTLPGVIRQAMEAAKASEAKAEGEVAAVEAPFNPQGIGPAKARRS